MNKYQKYYVYVLINPTTNIPFYVGCTYFWKKRRYTHNRRCKKQLGFTPIFEIKETVIGYKKASAAEYEWIRKMKELYGDAIMNKQLKKSTKYIRLKKDRKRHPITKTGWTYLTKKETELMFIRVPWGHYSIIAKMCNYSTERVRQVFVRKPLKLNPKLYHAIRKYLNLKAA